MNIELIENWAVSHCPKKKFYKMVLSNLKRKQVNRHKMTFKDIFAVESGNKEKSIVLKKYIKRWKKYNKKLEQQIKDYISISGKQIKVNDEIIEDIIFCRYAYGFMPDEYFAYHLENKVEIERKKYISDRDRLDFIYKVNDIVDMEIVRNKNLTYQYFKHYYHRDAICINRNTDFHKFVNFIKKNSVFVQKNVRKNCGQGVQLIDFNMLNLSYEDYYKKLMKDDEYILEERIEQSPIMSSFHGNSVNTVRCVTLITPKGIVVDHCFLKVGRNNSFLDNGAAGGLLIGIDKNNGKLNTDAFNEFSEIFESHPDSNVIFKDFQLPEWDSLLEIAIELANNCPNVRFVGWDLAHTAHGWVLVEGNGRSQVIGPQLVYGKGYKTHFSEIMNIQF